jgi:O-antigen/teichoic acid export membrane protein
VVRERLIYKTVLSLVTIAASGAIRLAFSLLVGHVFGPPTLGHANVIISGAVFATLLCSPGMGQSVARQMATRGLTIDSPQGRTILARATAGHHLVCLIVAAVAVVLIPTDGRAEAAMAFALTFGYGCYTYYKAVMYGVDQVARYAALELIWDALFAGTLVLVAVTAARSWLLAPMVLVYLGFALGAHVSLFGWRRRAITGRHDGTGLWRVIVPFAAVTTAGTASSAGFLQLSQIFAAHADPGHGSGLFAAAMSLVTPAYLLPRALSVVLFPAMARAAGRSDAALVRRQLVVGTDVLAAAMLPAFAFAGMIASALLALYGASFHGGATTLLIMLWATWVSIASVPAVNALSSDPGRAYLVPAAASVIGFAIGLAFWFALGTSIVMVAWGYLAGSVVQSVIPVVEAARRHGGLRMGLGLRSVLVAALGIVVGMSVIHRPIVVQVSVGVVAAIVAATAVLPELRGILRAWRVPSHA